MANNNPIGVFDSGVGGISIWKEIHQLLPNESSIYLADSINTPYGQKSKQEIIDLCFKNTDLLLKKGCKLIVVACNTATTNAIKQLRVTYNIPFIGIEPAIKPAALNSKTKSIGILATKGTLSSELFNNTTELYSENIKIVEQVGVGLVELIEAGYIDSEEMINLLKKYLNPMVKENIDHLVLGCSHYPFLIPIIKKIIPKNISIIDSGKAVAKQVEIILSEQNLLSNNNNNILNEFYTNSNTTVIKAILNNKYPVSKQDF
ncbi:MAG: glutamate racemase [Flavobacteriaceae bacterium]|nr:glutamate racemase [Flavobacteriaceae bacterium]